MPLPTCPRSGCTSILFMQSELSVAGTRERYVAVSCVSCGAIVSAQPAFSAAQVLQRLAHALRIRL